MPVIARHLLNVNIVFDGFHAFDTMRNLGGFIRLVPGRGRAGQRYYTPGGVDIDIASTGRSCWQPSPTLLWM